MYKIMNWDSIIQIADLRRKQKKAKNLLEWTKIENKINRLLGRE